MTTAALDPARFVRRQVAVACAINAVLSAAFYFVVFGPEATVTVGAPDRFASDFPIQGAIVGFASALPPALIARRAAAGPAGFGPVVRWSVLGTAIGLAAGIIAFAALSMAGPTNLPIGLAVALKMTLGVLLALAVTPRAVNAALRG